MQRDGITGFPALAGPNSVVLLLGSYPSPKSFDEGFYYGHPQNRFWKLMAELLQQAVPQTIEEKSNLILQNRLALWDSLQTCTILGASDSSISNPVPNNIAQLVQQGTIRHIFCNGAAAHKYYRLYNQAATGLPAVQLPSTSAANAAYSLPRLIQAWQPVVQALAQHS